MKLGPNQRVILGPPGCGKTTTLLRLLDEEMTGGVHPANIAYLSFTRKAVNEAKQRAVEQFNFEEGDLRYFRTLHAMCFAEGGFRRSDVMSLKDYTDLGQRIGVEFGGGRFDESTGMPVGSADGDVHLFVDSLARARRVTLEQQWSEANQPDLDFRAVERTIAAVTKYKAQHGLVDFTDMLQQYEKNGAPLAVTVAFVDEAQDLSRLQWAVLARMLRDVDRVYIAGDDDQAIYRWSGADVASFLSLEGAPEVLGQSWRCPQAVHALVDKLSSRISKRISKRWAPRDEVGAVESVHHLDSFEMEQLEGSTLLLARNTYLLTAYYDELRKRGLPFLTPAGYHSVARPHARAIIAWEKMRRGDLITGAEAKAIYDQMRVGVGVARGHKSLPHLRDDAVTNKDILRATMGLLTGDVPWYEALDGIAGKDRAYYRAILRGRRSLSAMPEIQVNTIHGVKGGEADNVVLNPDMASKTFKEYSERPDDEHRVAYVGASRSRKNLFILNPRTKNFYPYL